MDLLICSSPMLPWKWIIYFNQQFEYFREKLILPRGKCCQVQSNSNDKTKRLCWSWKCEGENLLLISPMNLLIINNFLCLVEVLLNSIMIPYQCQKLVGFDTYRGRVILGYLLWTLYFMVLFPLGFFQILLSPWNFSVFCLPTCVRPWHCTLVVA